MARFAVARSAAVLLFCRLLQASAGSGARFLQEAENVTETPIATTVTQTTTAIAVNTTTPPPITYANFLCGDFVRDCENVAHVSFGPDIWLKTTWSYQRDGSYTFKETGFFNKTACERDEPWMEIEYEGTWTDGGIVEGAQESRTLASVYVNSVWITLFHGEVCVETADGGFNCMETKLALAALCPCNGWDWGNDDGEPRKRNVGMFCMPYEQCPILHEAYLRKTQYFWYTADAGSVCSSEANTDPARGWARFDKEPTCNGKEQGAVCVALHSPAAGLQVGGAAHVFAFAATLFVLVSHNRAL